MFKSFVGNYSLYLQGDSLVHMDAEIQNTQTLLGAETQRRPASAFVILNYVQSPPGENTIFTLRVAMNSHISHNLQLPYF